MAEHLNLQTGLWETETDFVEPTLTLDEIASAAQLVEAGNINTTDPTGWVIDQAQKVVQRVKLLHEQGLDFTDPGILIGFSEEALSIDALLEVMDSRGLLCRGKTNHDDYIKGFQKRQKLRASGGVLLVDRQMQMRGQAQDTMAERVAATSQKITGAVKGLTAIQLGVVPTLQLYNQSVTVRQEMRGLATYTPDITADGDAASVFDWSRIGQAHVNVWAGFGNPGIGSRVAVVEKAQV